MGKNKVDQRHRLDEEAFSYRVNKDEKVFISWQGKMVMTLKDKQAEQFLAKVKNQNPKAIQLAMAKLTGNFKHGNERN